MEESTLTERENTRHDWSKEDYKEYRRAVVRKAQHKRRAKAREQGLCGICAKNPAVKGRSTCEQCYSRVLKWQWGKNEK